MVIPSTRCFSSNEGGGAKIRNPLPKSSQSSAANGVKVPSEVELLEAVPSLSSASAAASPNRLQKKVGFRSPAGSPVRLWRAAVEEDDEAPETFIWNRPPIPGHDRYGFPLPEWDQLMEEDDDDEQFPPLDGLQSLGPSFATSLEASLQNLSPAESEGMATKGQDRNKLGSLSSTAGLRLFAHDEKPRISLTPPPIARGGSEDVGEEIFTRNRDLSGSLVDENRKSFIYSESPTPLPPFLQTPKTNAVIKRIESEEGEEGNISDDNVHKRTSDALSRSPPASPSLSPFPSFYGDENHRRAIADFFDNFDSLPSSQVLRGSKTFLKLVKTSTGIPDDMRAEIWMLSSGARERQLMFPNYYHTLVDRVEPVGSTKLREIEMDLHRTFPGHPIYETEEGIAMLKNVLVAFSRHNTEIGYCQSLNFVAAILLLFCTPEESFFLLWIITENIVPEGYFSNLKGLHAEQRILRDYLYLKMPKLFNHLDALGLNIPILTTKWYMCLFTGILQTDVTLRIWDWMFVQGFEVVHRIALGIFQALEEQLLQGEDQSDVFMCFSTEVSRATRDCKVLFDRATKGVGMLSNFETLREYYTHQVDQEITLRDKKRRVMKLEKDPRCHYNKDELDLLIDSFSFRSTAIPSGVDEKTGVSSWSIDSGLFDHLQNVLDNVTTNWGDPHINISNFVGMFYPSTFNKEEILKDEFLCGLSTFSRGSEEEKLNLLFAAFTSSEGNVISKVDLYKMIERASRVSSMSTRPKVLNVFVTMILERSAEEAYAQSLKDTKDGNENQVNQEPKIEVVGLESFLSCARLVPPIAVALNLEDTVQTFASTHRFQGINEVRVAVHVTSSELRKFFAIHLRSENSQWVVRRTWEDTKVMRKKVLHQYTQRRHHLHLPKLSKVARLPRRQPRDMQRACTVLEEFLTSCLEDNVLSWSSYLLAYFEDDEVPAWLTEREESVWAIQYAASALEDPEMMGEEFSPSTSSVKVHPCLACLPRRFRVLSTSPHRPRSRSRFRSFSSMGVGLLRRERGYSATTGEVTKRQRVLQKYRFQIPVRSCPWRDRESQRILKDIEDRGGYKSEVKAKSPNKKPQIDSAERCNSHSKSRSRSRSRSESHDRRRSRSASGTRSPSVQSEGKSGTDAVRRPSARRSHSPPPPTSKRTENG